MMMIFVATVHLLTVDGQLQDKILAYYAGYDKKELQPVVNLMIDYLARPVIHEAFFKKYACKRFLKGK